MDGRRHPHRRDRRRWGDHLLRNDSARDQPHARRHHRLLSPNPAGEAPALVGLHPNFLLIPIVAAVGGLIAGFLVYTVRPRGRRPRDRRGHRGVPPQGREDTQTGSHHQGARVSVHDRVGGQRRQGGADRSDRGGLRVFRRRLAQTPGSRQEARRRGRDRSWDRGDIQVALRRGDARRGDPLQRWGLRGGGASARFHRFPGRLRNLHGVRRHHPHLRRNIAYTFTSPSNLVFYAILGSCAAWSGGLHTTAFYKAKGFFSSLEIPKSPNPSSDSHSPG